MIGNHAMAHGMRPGNRRAGLFRGSRDQVAEQIDIVIVVHTLHDGGDALQAHAGVDGRARQRLAYSAGLLLILHEDEIPDLDEAVAVFVRRTGRTAGDVLAVIVEDFGTGPAGAGLAHGPEIVGGRDADDF